MNRRTLIRALVRVRRLSTGTSAALGEAPIAGNKLPDFTALRTNIPTIFTCTPLDPVVHLDYITARCNVLFKQPARYVAPKELGYELPRDGLPEFAFVGRSNVGKSTLIAELLGNRGLGSRLLA